VNVCRSWFQKPGAMLLPEWLVADVVGVV